VDNCGGTAPTVPHCGKNPLHRSAACGQTARNPKILRLKSIASKKCNHSHFSLLRLFARFRRYRLTEAKQ
jgi:hypothetical protein